MVSGTQPGLTPGRSPSPGDKRSRPPPAPSLPMCARSTVCPGSFVIAIPNKKRAFRSISSGESVTRAAVGSPPTARILSLAQQSIRLHYTRYGSSTFHVGSSIQPARLAVALATCSARMLKRSGCARQYSRFAGLWQASGDSSGDSCAGIWQVFALHALSPGEEVVPVRAGVLLSIVP